ncbi:MAG: hypothetical protein MJ197_09890 [Bacteroidales bacterium]|nr:hypothetical protein [Bacteroidales bacterium]
MIEFEPMGFIKFLDCYNDMMTTYEMFDSVKILTEEEFYKMFDKIIASAPKKLLDDYDITIGDYFNLSMDDMINALNDWCNYDVNKRYIVEYFEKQI